MNDLQLRIITKAIEIRLKNGEEINSILLSYPKLTREEWILIKEHFNMN